MTPPSPYDGDTSPSRTPRRGGKSILAGGRQRYRKGRALAGCALDVEAAAVAVDDVLDDGEAQPGATQLARARGVDAVEALGEPRQMVGGDAVALVADGDGDPALAGRTRHHAHRGGGLGVLQRVVDQVLEHDGELVIVADRAGQFGCEAELERHLARRGLQLQQV